jgi:hypothetical protein
MLIRNLQFTFAVALIAALGACDGSALTGPQDSDEAVQKPLTRTACMAGGDVAQRAGCPEDTWSNDDDADVFNPWVEDLSPREKRPT